MLFVQEHTNDDVQYAAAAWTMSHARNCHGMHRSGDAHLIIFLNVLFPAKADIQFIVN